MDQKTKVGGVIGLLVMLVSAGIIYLPDGSTSDNTFICSVTKEIAVFSSLSSTAKTGYWIDEAGVKKSKTCTNGIWINIAKYAKDNNLQIADLTNSAKYDSNQNTQNLQIVKYRCNEKECVKI